MSKPTCGCCSHRGDLRRGCLATIHGFRPPAPRPSSERRKSGFELHLYDVLRADRCISVHSMEAGVPFGDLDFVRYVMSVDPAKKLNTYGKGKYLLRRAFEGDYLPHDLLYREKAAFPMRWGTPWWTT